MKRNASAQAGDGKLESRFAALTSGLLARKGSAAPSNSPIQDPAEETDAFALEPTRKTVKPKGQSVAAPARKIEQAAEPVMNVSAAPAKKPEPRTEARKNSPPAKPKQEAAQKSSDDDSVEPMTIINERSFEAGYPENPTPEEIAALEAEANEVVSYFENFGTEDAVAMEKGDFYADDEVDAPEDLDDLDDPDDLDGGAPPANAIKGPWAGASVPAVASNMAVEVRAGVTVQLTAREFMRLSLGAAELGQPAQELIVEAIEEYLDARGVLSLGGCSCLDSLTKKRPAD